MQKKKVAVLASGPGTPTGRNDAKTSKFETTDRKKRHFELKGSLDGQSRQRLLSPRSWLKVKIGLDCPRFRQLTTQQDSRLLERVFVIVHSSVVRIWETESNFDSRPTSGRQLTRPNLNVESSCRLKVTFFPDSRLAFGSFGIISSGGRARARCRNDDFPASLCST